MHSLTLHIETGATLLILGAYLIPTMVLLAISWGRGNAEENYILSFSWPIAAPIAIAVWAVGFASRSRRDLAQDLAELPEREALRVVEAAGVRACCFHCDHEMRSWGDPGPRLDEP